MKYIKYNNFTEIWTSKKNPTPNHCAGTIRKDNNEIFFETGSDLACLTASDLREIADEMEKS